MGVSTNPRIEHVVVVMMENRSFDHMFGFLPHPDPDFEGLIGKDMFNEFPVGTPLRATSGGVPIDIDPDHSHAGAKEQIEGFGSVPYNGGFVRNYEARRSGDGPKVMQCLDPPTACPVMSTLALEFAVCDAWFSSVPGETWPNRNFAHAATSDSSVNIEFGFFYDPTTFEQIAKAGGTWHVYFDGTPEVWCFRRLWRTRTIIDFLLRRPARIANFYDMPDFYGHVEKDCLPNYSFIEPKHNRFNERTNDSTNSQHPGNNCENIDDFQAGEQLIKRIYQSLAAQPDLFARTLLVILYDEHGGFYDHVKPSGSVPPGDPVYRGLTRRIGRFVRALVDWHKRAATTPPFDFTTHGVRVPAVLVSPWIEPGTRVSKCFDHSSVPATLRDLFARGAQPLTDRDAQANTFHDVVDTPRQQPRGPVGPAGTPGGAPDALPDLAALPGPPPPVGHPRSPSPAVNGSGVFDEQLRELSKRVHRRVAWRPSVVMSRVRWRARRTRRLSEEVMLPRPEGVRGLDTVEAFLHLAEATRRRADKR
jgi:phospholipase C